MPALILYILFFLSIILLTGWWLLLFARLLRYHDPAPAGLPPVSVIIAARNEAHNLQANLPSVLTQNYPKYEVIVVDDHSADGTVEELVELQRQYPALGIVRLPMGKKGKKQAVTAGISAAEYAVILVTDADCVPATSHWIRGMAGRLGDSAMLLGYGPMFKTGTPLNAFARFETVMTAIQYFSWALAGRPYMGVGRNMLYRKSLFAETGGFDSHIDLASGDDDLFVRTVSGKHPVGICLDPDTFMYSGSKETVHDFLGQKTRHVSTSGRYAILHKAGLALFAAAQMLFYPVAFALMILEPSLDIGLLIAAAILVRMMIFMRIAPRLEGANLVWKFPILDFMYSLYLWVMMIKMWLPGQTEWKS